MKLVASLIVKDEGDRYLPLVIEHLLEFCDELRIVDDGSHDRWWAQGLDGRVAVQTWERSSFFEHEGRARQHLLDWTLAADPTHVLAIDADEFVTDGAELRRTLERDREAGAWSLCMEEVWRCSADRLWVRDDGGWRGHDAPIAWRAPVRPSKAWQLPDRALASGRTPDPVRRLLAACSGSGVLHFGWANEADRAGRHARYAQHDAGKYHRAAHLDSILYDDSRVQLVECLWPDSLSSLRGRVVAQATLPAR